MRRQKGNALFLILIAVALFAALSYAITQSSRGGGTIDKESAAIAAGQITQYTADLRTAVQRMILSGGVSPASIEYTKDCGAIGVAANCLFKPEGGGQTYHWCESTYQMVGVPGDDHNGHGSWAFRGANGGSEGRADNGNGYYIADVGTNTDVTGRDAFVMMRDGGGTSLAVCQQINKQLGISDWETPADNSNFNIMSSGPAYNVSANVIYAYPGRPFACVNQGGGPRGYDGYGYYHALIEQ